MAGEGEGEPRRLDGARAPESLRASGPWPPHWEQIRTPRARGKKMGLQNRPLSFSTHSEVWGRGARAQFTGSPRAQSFHARTQSPLCTYCSPRPLQLRKSLT